VGGGSEGRRNIGVERWGLQKILNPNTETSTITNSGGWLEIIHENQHARYRESAKTRKISSIKIRKETGDGKMGPRVGETEPDYWETASQSEIRARAASPAG